MIGKILGNRYEIVEKVGGGGMALVYKAKCNLLNRYVAVKILRSEFTNDKDILEKFKRESQAAASLSHPNIVNTYDVGEEGEIQYIVMEYVKGKTLKELIKEKGILSLEEIIDYSKQIAMALRHAHQNHVIHRDIKPHNILITEDNRAKVTDFGIALAANSSTITNMGSVIGSVHYFSPEQARGGYIDEKSDLYSLGIVMYEMATGKVPFEGESPITIALKHIQQEAPQPSEFNPKIAKGLEEIIVKLTQKEQLSRYLNAESFIEDLNKFKNTTEESGLSYSDNDEEDFPTQIIPRIKDEDVEGISPKREMNKSKKKKNNKVIITGAVIAALVTAFLVVFAIFYVGNFLGDNEVEVPEFVGIEIEDARNLAEELGLRLTEETQHHRDVPAGEIIRQNPVAGMRVRPDYTVTVHVSDGPRLVEVPDLVFEDALNVRYVLQNEGLVVGNVSYEFSDLPNGVVRSQDPRAGTEVAEGTTVDYVISQGPEVVTFSMPNLVNNTLENARATLQQLGLQIGNIREEYNEEYDRGRVISQSIEAGREVRENAVVNLTVSRGPEEIEEEEDVEIDIEDEIDGEDTDEGVEEPTEEASSTSTKTIKIELKGYSGTVDIEIRRTTGAREVVSSTKHNVQSEGNIAEVTLAGSHGERFDLYINGRKQSSQIQF